IFLEPPVAERSRGAADARRAEGPIRQARQRRVSVGPGPSEKAPARAVDGIAQITAENAETAEKSLLCVLCDLRGYTCTLESARMIASLNAGTSSGLREVIRLPSST